MTSVARALRRDLNLLDAVGIGVGAIVGAGIFVVTGVAAGIAGPGLLAGLVLAGVAAICNALSSAELAAAYPASGGTYEYGYRVLTPAWGFTAGWMFLAGKTAAAGTVALGLGGYMETLVPGVPARFVAVAGAVGFTALNWFGVRRTSRLNLLVVALSVGALVTFVLAGLPHLSAGHLRPFAPYGWRGVLEGAALLFFAYTGYARIATLGEEVRDPTRVIPRAIILTIAGTLVLYAAVALVAVGSVGAPVLAASAAPLEAAARSFDAAWAVPVVAVGGIAAMLGVMLSQLLGLSRMAFAMGRRGDLPTMLAHLHPRHEVPDRAIIVVGAIVTVVAATGTLRGVASAAAFTILLYYGIANLAALRMPRASKRYPDLVPIVGMVACAGLALSLNLRTVLLGLVVMAAGFVVRAAVRFIRRASRAA